MIDICAKDTWIYLSSKAANRVSGNRLIDYLLGPLFKVLASVKFRVPYPRMRVSYLWRGPGNYPTDQGKLQLKHRLSPPFPIDLMRVKLHDSRAR